MCFEQHVNLLRKDFDPWIAPHLDYEHKINKLLPEQFIGLKHLLAGKKGIGLGNN